MAEESYTTPGGIKIEHINLTNYDQSKIFDIMPIVYEFNIFESMNKPFVTASFLIDDALSLITQFPIVGQETISIKFKTPGNAFLKPIELTLRVISITEMKRANIREVSYVLNCVSPMLIKDLNTKIRKAYKDTTIDQMAIDIMSTYLESEFVKVDPTIGDRTIIIPNMSPSNAIKFLTRQAKSLTYKSSPYYFYQTCDGFYFRTSNDIIDPEKKSKYTDGSSIDKYYAMDFDFSKGKSPRDALDSGDSGYSGGKGMTSTKPYEFLKIKSFVFHNVSNYYNGFKSGFLENKISFFDPITSFYEEKKYDYLTNNDEFKKTSQSQASQFLTKDNDYIKTGDGFNLFEITNHTQVNTYPNSQSYDVLNSKIGVKSLFENVNATVSIPGDSEKRAGEVIDFEFPEYGGTEDVMGKINKFLSGEYLILAVRHIYNFSGYETVMTVSKNAYENSIENPELPKSTSVSSETNQTTNNGAS